MKSTTERRYEAFDALVALEKWFKDGTGPRLHQHERDAIRTAMAILNEYKNSGY